MILKKLTKVPILGAVGHNEKKSELPVFENPKTALAESFRSLRANLQYFMKEKDKKVIVLSSTVSGEGKTFCAVNLAAINCHGRQENPAGGARPAEAQDPSFF